MEQRAARQAEARENWVEGLSFQPASIKQAERPPLSAGDQAKETVEKVRADELKLPHDSNYNYIHGMELLNTILEWERAY